jgi:transmembrane sensor
MKLKNNLKLFAKLYFGLASKKERKDIFNSEESNDMMDKEWKISEEKIKRGKSEKKIVYSKIQDQIFSTDNRETKRKQAIAFIQKYAALFLIVLSLSVVLTYILVNDKTSEQLVYITKENPKGNRSSFLLPDGTKVWLNADSKLVYPKEFSQSLREVNLTGEAFFKVSENLNKPFRVVTEHIDVEVLGTSFNLEAYPSESTVQTTLVSGKIAVSDNSQMIERHRYVMNKDHLAVFNKADRSFVIDKVDVRFYTSWKDGKLLFDNKTFSEIRKELERVYDVTFIEGTELIDNFHYTITLTDETIEEVMQLISKSTPINYLIEENNIYLKEIKK